MLKEFAQYIVSLGENKTYEINGETYSDSPLHRIEPHVDHPDTISFASLDSIITIVRREAYYRFSSPIYIRVRSEDTVDVFTSLSEKMQREKLYTAKCEVSGFRDGFRPLESAVIELRSRFIQSGDIDYLLDLISRINVNDGVTTSDNGISQTVEARSGISLKSMVPIKPRITLQPFRTFPEVEQPVSEFLLRISDDGKVGLFEADGGMWRLDAKRKVRDYIEKSLHDLVECGFVEVMA